MSPDSPTGRAEVGGATRLRRPVEEADDQEPTYGDVLGDSIAALRGCCGTGSSRPVS